MNVTDKKYKIRTIHISGLTTTGTMLYTYGEAIQRKDKLDKAFPEENHEIIIDESETV